MTSKVSQILETTPKNNPSLVERLELMLEQAKDGELLGIAYACQWKGDLTSNSWSLSKMEPRRIVGELEFLKHRMIEGMG